MKQQIILGNKNLLNNKQKLNFLQVFNFKNIKKKKLNLAKKSSFSRIPIFNRNLNFKKRKLIGSLKRYLQFKTRLSSLIIYKKSLPTKLKNKLVIRVTGNNFFCTFINLKKKKVQISKSAKQLNFKTSKKKISFNLPLVLSKFKDLLISKKIFFIDKKIKKKISLKKKVDFMPKILFFKIIAKKRIRRKIINMFYFGRHMKRNRLRIFFIDPKKCFNGCRAVKARRKKRLRFRIFK